MYITLFKQLSINIYFWVYKCHNAISSIILSYRSPHLISYLQHLHPFFYHRRLTFCLTATSESLQNKLETIILCYLSGSFISVLKINLTEWLWWQHTIIAPHLLVVLPYLISTSIIFVDLQVIWAVIKARNMWWKSK